MQGNFKNQSSETPRTFARRTAVRAAWVTPAIVMASAAPALACSPGSQPPETHQVKATDAQTAGSAAPIDRKIAVPSWATVMSFTVIGGAGGSIVNRDGEAGTGAKIEGSIVVTPGQQVRLLPGSGGYRNAGAAKNQTNPGGKVAWTPGNSLTHKPNGGHGLGGRSAGGGAASILEIGGKILALAGGGGGISETMTTGYDNGSGWKFIYDHGNTLWAARGPIPQGDGNAGVPSALDQVAAGNRGEGGVLWVSAYGASVDNQITKGQFAMGIEGGAGGGANAGGAPGAPINVYAQANIYPDGTMPGNPGGHGFGGNAPYQGGSKETYPSGGGGGGGYYGGGSGSLVYGSRNDDSDPYAHGAGSGGGGGSSWVHPSVLDLSAGSQPNQTSVGIDSSGYGMHGLVSITFSC